MTETRKILKYYFVTTILLVLITAGICGFLIAGDNSEFMLFGNFINPSVAKILLSLYNVV